MVRIDGDTAIELRKLKMPECHSCAYSCEEFIDLAKHIVKMQHKNGLKWAMKFLANAQYLDAKVSRQNQERIPLTEQERENKTDCHRELSGQELEVFAVCPICHKNYSQVIPLEHSENPLAWRNGKYLIISCGNCRR